MIKKSRVNASLNHLIEKNYAALNSEDRADQSLKEAAAYQIADAAIYIYREKIAAALRRAGLDIGDTDDLDTAVILEAVKVKTGVDLTSFNVNEVREKVISGLSTAMTERLGFEIDLKNGLDRAIEDAATAALAAGGRSLLTSGKKALLRNAGVARRAGVGLDVVNKAFAAKRQSEWRKQAPPAYWVSK
jgi:hypothetical protein